MKTLILLFLMVLTFSGFSQIVTITIPADTNKVPLIQDFRWYLIHRSKLQKFVTKSEQFDLLQTRFNLAQQIIEDLNTEVSDLRNNIEVYKGDNKACESLVLQLQQANLEQHEESVKLQKRLKTKMTIVSVAAGVLGGAALGLIIYTVAQ